MTITTSDQKKNLGPEYWEVECLLSDGSTLHEQGFATLNAALKRLRSLQVLSHPSTIEHISMSQLLEEKLDPEVQAEIDYLDELFLQAMENPNK